MSENTGSSQRDISQSAKDLKNRYVLRTPGSPLPDCVVDLWADLLVVVVREDGVTGVGSGRAVHTTRY